MRVTVAAIVLVALAAAGGAEGQLTVGPNGLKTPPINLLSIFRFLRDFFMAVMFPPADDANKATGKEDLETPTMVEEAQQWTTDMGYDTEGNIIEKFDSGCVDDGSGLCLETSNHLRELDAHDDDTALASDKTTTMQLVAGKWPLAYITFITITFWLFVLLATPYIVTGETYTRSDDNADSNGLVDQQDVLLLLSWLLGEASNDKSCLERIVCLTPTKSSQYISVSSMVFKVAGFLRGWVPYSPRYVDLLHHLDEITQDGYSSSCQKYYCPTVPEL